MHSGGKYGASAAERDTELYGADLDVSVGVEKVMGLATADNLVDIDVHASIVRPGRPCELIAQTLSSFGLTSCLS